MLSQFYRKSEFGHGRAEKKAGEASTPPPVNKNIRLPHQRRRILLSVASHYLSESVAEDNRNYCRADDLDSVADKEQNNAGSKRNL